MFDFYGKRRIYFIISAAIMLIGIAFTFINGVKLDITFSGGAKITYGYTGGELNTDEVAKLVKSTINRDATVQNAVGYEDSANSLVVSLAGTKSLTTEDQDKLFDALNAKYKDSKLTQGSTTNVEAAIGNRFLRNGLIAIGLAALFIIFYVAIRFSIVSGFTAGFTALIALIHDIALVFFIFVIFKMPINDGFIAVVLTILGYSVNDTLVVFDRIRENKRLNGNKIPLNDLVNKSIKQSFARTINTSLMSLTAIILVLAFAIVKGIDSIVYFALPMAIGILSGCYSSTLIAPCLWCSIKSKKK